MSNLGQRKKNTYNYEAPVAGAGGGTLLVLLAKNLPDNNAFKPWLILIAPAVSIALSTFWTWSKSQLDTYVSDKKRETVFKQLRQELEDDLKNPHTSEEHKNRIRCELEKIEILRIKSITEKLEISIENK